MVIQRRARPWLPSVAPAALVDLVFQVAPAALVDLVFQVTPAALVDLVFQVTPAALVDVVSRSRSGGRSNEATSIVVRVTVTVTALVSQRRLGSQLFGLFLLEP